MRQKAQLPLKRAAPPDSPNKILKKCRRQVEDALDAIEKIASKIAYDALHAAPYEENLDIIDAKPTTWTRAYQERLERLALATAEFNYHFRFGFVEDMWYSLTQLISIKRGKTFYFPSRNGGGAR